MKCNSIRKEDDFVTVCVLCTLSFWKSDCHQILLLLCPWCQFTVPAHWIWLKWGYKSNFRKEVFWKCIIPDLSFHSLLIVNIWKTEIRLSMAQFHYQALPPGLSPLFMRSSVFLSNPHLSCLPFLFGCVSNIVQCSTWEYLIKRQDLLGLQRSEQFSRWSHLLCTHSFTKSYIHILFFYISCVYMYSASICGGYYFACICFQDA